ncbi:gastrula zinc finger protein XlCGF17.1-like [Xyrichtys novacula]|uniref:Gastrula zinc finger protein XlCGF17.1-like n=1 Tax=Xyrichtys novacula TaxID=13765 RepID=A0AAV1FZI5_XYRNO|nr:gastrula zinc finger protein XlCGF17.1-like [Xyrichtys novacula]
MKEEDTPVKISKMKEHTQVKEEGVDVSVTPDIKADTPNNAEVQFAKSETPKTTSDSELILSPPTADVSVKQSIDDDEWNEADRASSPDQGPSVEVIVNLEQPARDEKRCRFCGKNFRKDSSLIWHVNRTHKGQKAFKCLKCNMEFDQRSQLVKHTRKHTAVKKSFKCDFCERTFSQNSSCIVHMRVHTGEKPYFCKNCGKSFAYSGHLKFCNFQSKLKSPPEKVKPEETLKEEKRFSCSDCSKEFRYKYQLVEHIRIHTGEKPYGCGICGKTYAHISARNSHLKAHSTEKPYFCKNCGRSFKRKRHLQFCTSREKTFRCETCGKTFYTKSQLDVHFEVHEAWKRHIREKVQESKLEDKSPTSL